MNCLWARLTTKSLKLHPIPTPDFFSTRDLKPFFGGCALQRNMNAMSAYMVMWLSEQPSITFQANKKKLLEMLENLWFLRDYLLCRRLDSMYLYILLYTKSILFLCNIQPAERLRLSQHNIQVESIVITVEKIYQFNPLQLLFFSIIKKSAQ